MNRAKLFHYIFPFVILSVPWIYLSIIWNQLPETIPTHFGISGLPDKFGQKNEIIVAPAIISIIGLFTYFLMINIHKIDPKKKYKATTAGTLSKLAVVTLLFLCGTCLMIIYWTLKGHIVGDTVLFSAIGLFFAYIGNLMYSIKPNYFAGFRLPWTLENEENWRKTHQLASKIWFAGGIVIALISLFLRFRVLLIVFMSLVFIMVIIPVIFSYILYRKSSASSNLN